MARPFRPSRPSTGRCLRRVTSRGQLSYLLCSGASSPPRRRAALNARRSQRMLQVCPDWRSTSCAPSQYNASLAVNAISNESVAHHSAVRDYVPMRQVSVGGPVVYDWLGNAFPRQIYCNNSYTGQLVSYAARNRLCSIVSSLDGGGIAEGASTRAQMATAWPVIDEEYFELLDVLSAVSEYSHDIRRRSRPFTVVELGCGYAHWLTTANGALNSIVGTAAPRTFLGVDVVPGLRNSVEEVAKLNVGMQGTTTFHAGFIAPGGVVTRKASKGQAFITNMFTKSWHVANNGSVVPTVSLPELFRLHRLPCVIDLLDADVQHSEYSIFTREIVSMLTHSVRRVHIGTHGYSGEDPRLRALFEAHNWTTVWSYARSTKAGPPKPTEFGPVRFADGVLSFLNPRRLPVLAKHCEMTTELAW